MLDLQIEVDIIMNFFCGKNRLWLQVLNNSLEDTIQIKEEVIGFFVVEPEKLKFHH